MWIHQNEPELFNNKGRKMGFGKHRDQTWDWVIENDNSYTDGAARSWVTEIYSNMLLEST